MHPTAFLNLLQRLDKSLGFMTAAEKRCYAHASQQSRALASLLDDRSRLRPENKSRWDAQHAEAFAALEKDFLACIPIGRVNDLIRLGEYVERPSYVNRVSRFFFLSLARRFLTLQFMKRWNNDKRYLTKEDLTALSAGIGECDGLWKQAVGLALSGVSVASAYSQFLDGVEQCAYRLAQRIGDLKWYRCVHLLFQDNEFFSWKKEFEPDYMIDLDCPVDVILDELYACVFEHFKNEVKWNKLQNE